MKLIKLLLCITFINCGIYVTEAKDIDYYKILGVSRSATDRDIKKSFRKLAVKYHPDKNKEKGAEEKFKDIAQAYEILSDTDKRRKFDQFGSSAFETGGSSQENGFHFNFDDIFRNFEDDLEGNTFHFSSSEGFAEQHAGHGHGSNFFNFEDFFQEEEDSFMNNHYGYEPHTFGGGSSFFGSHFSHNERMQQQPHQEQQSSQGRSCRTITQRVGSMVTTYTQCS